MVSQKHERILIKTIEILKKNGLRVIRLDNRTVPDAVAIDFHNKTVSAIEASTRPSNIYLTRHKYERLPRQFDEEIIATLLPPKRRQSKDPKAYFLALELKAKGYTERAIRKEVELKTGEKVSNGTIHYWVTGQSRPWSVIL